MSGRRRVSSSCGESACFLEGRLVSPVASWSGARRGPGVVGAGGPRLVELELQVEGGEVWFQASCPHEVDSGEEGAVHVGDVPDCESPRSLDR